MCSAQIEPRYKDITECMIHLSLTQCITFVFHIYNMQIHLRNEPITELNSTKVDFQAEKKQRIPQI